MNREEFVRRHAGTWDQVEKLLDLLESGHHGEHELAHLPALYRRTCHHLALARQRCYGAGLEARLNRIALRGYHQLYRGRRISLASIERFFAVEFPRLVRANAALFWLATALFYGPGLAMGALVLNEPEAIYSLLDPETVQEFEEMYRTRPAEERGAATDFKMFGFYIWNNISIAFRTFASGLIAGVGTLFFLVFNGLFLGAVLAHQVNVGSAIHLVSFVITHGAFELTALVISGVAGLRLGTALIAPGRFTRGEALRRTAPECAQLVLGVAAMLVVAAFLEAFWSSTVWAPPAGKLATGAVAWSLVVLYLGLVGRGRRESRGS